MAAKMDKRNYKTYVLMGDGEQGEGSIYEAAMAARQYKLDNLVAVIDRNHLQISGDTEDVMGIDDIRDRWTAFGWEVKDMNGDDMEDIIRTFRSIDYMGCCYMNGRNYYSRWRQVRRDASGVGRQ